MMFSPTLKITTHNTLFSINNSVSRAHGTLGPQKTRHTINLEKGGNPLRINLSKHSNTNFQPD